MVAAFFNGTNVVIIAISRENAQVGNVTSREIAMITTFVPLKNAATICAVV
jgi:hypothetical protein